MENIKTNHHNSDVQLSQIITRFCDLRVSCTCAAVATGYFIALSNTVRDLHVGRLLVADNYMPPEEERFNPLTPKDPYSGHTAPLTSKRCILYIYSTNIGTEYFKHGIYSPFFPLQNV